MPTTLRKRVLYWMLFFLICMGLGYPTLHRYDPRNSGVQDAGAYHSMVIGATDADDFSHRVLIPYLARPIYWLANHRLHTWDPVFFSLLVVNAFFMATTAALLVEIAFSVIPDGSTAMLGAFVYLANFAVANYDLAGLVDSGVNCLLLAMCWSLLRRRWWLLPLLGIIGSAAKETFLPLALVLAFAWWVTTSRRGSTQISQLLWIGGLFLAGFVTLKALMSLSPVPYSPLSFASSRSAGAAAGHLFLRGLFGCLFSREVLYTFVWLLPVGLLRIGRLPRAWVTGSACAALAALGMSAYNDAHGNAARPIFSAIGPLLSLSAALFLAETGKRGKEGSSSPARDVIGASSHADPGEPDRLI